MLTQKHFAAFWKSTSCATLVFIAFVDGYNSCQPFSSRNSLLPAPRESFSDRFIPILVHIEVGEYFSFFFLGLSNLILTACSLLVCDTSIALCDFVQEDRNWIYSMLFSSRSF